MRGRGVSTAAGHGAAARGVREQTWAEAHGAVGDLLGRVRAARALLSGLRRTRAVNGRAVRLRVLRAGRRGCATRFGGARVQWRFLWDAGAQGGRAGRCGRDAGVRRKPRTLSHGACGQERGASCCMARLSARRARVHTSRRYVAHGASGRERGSRDDGREYVLRRGCARGVEFGA